MCAGAGAVEFIICHAEIQVVFVEEKKIAEVGAVYIIIYITCLYLYFIISKANNVSSVRQSES